VVLHKEGYVVQPLTVDPAHDRKLLVKLEKNAKAAPVKQARHGRRDRWFVPGT